LVLLGVVLGEEAENWGKGKRLDRKKMIEKDGENAVRRDV